MLVQDRDESRTPEQATVIIPVPHRGRNGARSGPAVRQGIADAMQDLGRLEGLRDDEPDPVARELGGIEMIAPACDQPECRAPMSKYRVRRRNPMTASQSQVEPASHAVA